VSLWPCTVNAVTKDKTFILIFASEFNCPFFFGLHLKFDLQFAFEDCLPTGFSIAFCHCANRAFLYLPDPASCLWPKRWHYKRTQSYPNKLKYETPVYLGKISVNKIKFSSCRANQPHYCTFKHMKPYLCLPRMVSL
jgi:hypothetical protein